MKKIILLFIFVFLFSCQKENNEIPIFFNPTLTPPEEISPIAFYFYSNGIYIVSCGEVSGSVFSCLLSYNNGKIEEESRHFYSRGSLLFFDRKTTNEHIKKIIFISNF